MKFLINRYLMLLFALLALTTVPRQAAAQTDIRTTYQNEAPSEVGGVAGLSAGNQMPKQLVNTSPAGFPDAVCNDESPAAFYFRPYTGSENANRWIIVLQGGGDCGDDQSCSRRWFAEDTLLPGFGSNSMSAVNLPDAINGNGVLERVGQNPMGDWNHVLIHYCSSDRWTGTSRSDVVAYFPPVPLSNRSYQRADPWVTHQQPGGGDVRMRLPFLGRKIVDAVTDTLRRAGPDGTLRYRGSPLPNLDDAEAVVLAGGSAGGLGVINNLDHLSSYLRQHHTPCPTNATCPFLVAGISDSAFPPLLQNVDLNGTPGCVTLIKCTWDEQMDYSVRTGRHRMWGARGDASCEAWHAAMDPLHPNHPDHIARCADEGYVLTNHVTSRIFVRMGQEDSLLAGYYQSLHVQSPVGVALTTPEFARLVRDQSRALANVTTTGMENAFPVTPFVFPIHTAPGAFVPTCAEHDTLLQTKQVFGVTIRNGDPPPPVSHLRLFGVVRAWLQGGGGPSILVAEDAAHDHCVP